MTDDENVLTLVMTRAEALSCDLLRCACGHRPNNHFDHGNGPCAHCKCTAYRERPVVGKLVST